MNREDCDICRYHEKLLREGRYCDCVEGGGLTKQLRALCRGNLTRHIKAKHPEVTVIT